MAIDVKKTLAGVKDLLKRIDSDENKVAPSVAVKQLAVTLTPLVAVIEDQERRIQALENTLRGAR